MSASRRVVEQAVARGDRVYGVTTGFGKFADVAIPAEQLEELQRNLVRSHAAGVGDAAPGRRRARDDGPARQRARQRDSRASASRRSRRFSTCSRRRTPDRSRTGLGRRIGRPRAARAPGPRPDGRGRRCAGADAVVPAARRSQDAGISPVALAAKEGLALINGVQMSVAVGGLALRARSRPLPGSPISSGAASLDAARGSDAAFDPRVIVGAPASGRDGRERKQPADAARRAARSASRTAAAAGSRTTTRCAACPRSTAPRATRSPRARGPRARDEQRDGQSRSSSRRGADSSRAATSTARPSVSSSTTRRSRRPTSPRSRNGASRSS